MKTLKNNKLIAEFLGYIDNGCSEDGFLIHPITNYDVEISSLKYHEDWNWLMEVVEKIESLDFGKWYVHIIGGKEYSTVKIEDGNDGIGLWDCMINVPDCVGFGDDVNLTKIEAVYKAVVEFIKFYNNNLVK